jgi:RNA-binding protein 25
VTTRERLATWDDDREVERGRELFYVDRNRWRAQRRMEREKEIAADRRDQELEQQQMEALKRESEAFLDKQAAIFAKMADGKRRTGASLDDSTPIKLSFGAPKAPSSAAAAGGGAGGAGGEAQPRRPAVLGAAEDEDEGAGRKRRELIPLSYSDDEDEDEKGLNEEEKMERRKKKVQEIVASIPAEKEGLWNFTIDWSQIDEVCLRCASFELGVNCTDDCVSERHHGEDPAFCCQKDDRVPRHGRRRA